MTTRLLLSLVVSGLASGCVPAGTSDVDEDAGRADDGGSHPMHDAGTPCDSHDRPARVLFIGNSYTANNGGLDSWLRALAEQHADCSFSPFTAKHAPGGALLADHAAAAETPGNALHSLLHDPLGWDVVVLQDQSQVPGFGADDPNTLSSRNALKETLVPLADAARARVVLLMTWGHRDGDPLNADLYPDYETMQAALAQGYETYRDDAASVATRPVTIAPAGLAFDWVHDGDDGALAAERFAALYADDGKHPSALGSYLAAATLFAAMTGLDPTGSGASGALALDEKPWLDEAALAANAE